MKRILALVMGLMAFVGAWAENEQQLDTRTYAGWTIELYYLPDSAITYQRVKYQLDGCPQRTLFNKMYCTGLYSKKSGNSWGADKYLDSPWAEKNVTVEETVINDEFGYGRRYRYTYTIAAGSTTTKKHVFRKDETRDWEDGYLIQDIYLYVNHPYLITQVTVKLKDQTTQIRSNYLLPLRSDNKEFFLQLDDHNNSTLCDAIDDSNRVLQVPFDNDNHVWWGSYRFDKSGNSVSNLKTHSWNVSAVYNGGRADRCGYGLIVGAIDHDTWKNDVYTELREDHEFMVLQMRSGYATSNSGYNGGTHDRYLGHSYVKGQSVTSARFMMAWMEGWDVKAQAGKNLEWDSDGKYYKNSERVIHPDWRDGMELYAEACQLAHPSWKWMGRKPIGWSSWGVLQFQMDNNKNKDTSKLTAVANYLNTTLRGLGFRDTDGKIYFSIDSGWDETEYTHSNWTNGTDNDHTKGLDYNKLLTLSNFCKENNLLFGLYITPFTDWSRSTGENYVPGTNNAYKWKDLWLYQNGNKVQFDTDKATEGFAIDPTHPGTRMYILYKLNLAKKLGAHYLKLDFLSHGAVEADSWYDKNIQTGMQAYNQGMQFIKNWIQANYPEGDMFVNLSIAPMMSHQYAHGRRIACDTFSQIGTSKGTNETTREEMNANSYGWWLSGLYAYNDPDHLVLRNRKGVDESEGENRARLTSGLVTGMFLLGDNFSGTQVASETISGDNSGKNRAETYLAKTGFMDAVRNSQSGWRPVFADWVNGSNSAENFFTIETNKAYYVAAFNYDASGAISSWFGRNKDATNTFDLRYHLGLTDAECANIKGVYEIWEAKTYTMTDYKFSFTVPQSDARIFCLEKINGEEEKEVTSEKNFYSKDTQNQFEPLYRGTPSLADYNNSGRLSIYYGGENNEEWHVKGMLYTHNGDGTFTKSFSYCKDGTVHNDANGLPPMAQGYSRWFDYNNDGNLDFFVNTQKGVDKYEPASCTMLYKNGGNGSNFTQVATFLNGQNEHGTNNNGANNSSVSFADYDHDGYTDIVQQAYTDARHVTLYHNNGTGTFTAKELHGMTHGGVAFGDLTGNGYADIVSVGYGSSGCEFYIHQNKGDGTFTEINAVSAKGFRGLMNSDVALADLDGDGDLDIIATGCDSDWGRYTDIYINNGNLNFTKKEYATHNIHGANEGTLHVVDINRDGRPDVIISGDFGKKLTDAENSKGQGIRIYLQKEDGTFEMEYKSGLGILSLTEQYGDDCGSGFAMGDLYGRHAQEVMMNGRLYAEAYKLYNANTTTPTKPTNVQVTLSDDNTTATVTWTPVSGRKDISYNVYARNVGTGETIMLLPAHIGNGRLKTYQDMQNTVRGTGTTLSYKVKLKSGRWHFGVQSVDQAWETSEFVDANQEIYILEKNTSLSGEAGPDGVIVLEGGLTSTTWSDLKTREKGNEWTAYDLATKNVEIPEDITLAFGNPNTLVIATENQRAKLGNTKNVVVGTNIYGAEFTDAKNVNTKYSGLTAKGRPVFHRTFAAGAVYGTMMIPFALTPAQLTAANLTVYELTTSESTGNEVTLNFSVPREGTKAGVPYVIKNNATATARDIVLTGSEGTTLDFTKKDQGTSYVFMGAYSKQKFSEITGSYYYYGLPSKKGETDGKGAEVLSFVKAGSNAWSDAFHCFLRSGKSITLKARFYNGDWEDGIGEIDNGESAIGNEVYDLSGRKVMNGKWENGKLRKGVYIINGEKKAVK